MTKTASRAALLHVALQDLGAGKRAQAERLPAIRDAAADGGLRDLLSAEIDRAAAQAERLAGAGGEGGPENLWMDGILHDAERDAHSHQPGPIRDVALIGAVRKAKAAEIVSGETALALARADGLDAIAEAVAANMADEKGSDRALRAALERLTA